MLRARLQRARRVGSREDARALFVSSGGDERAEARETPYGASHDRRAAPRGVSFGDAFGPPRGDVFAVRARSSRAFAPRDFRRAPLALDRGFASSALAIPPPGHRASFASSAAPEPSPRASGAPPPPPFPVTNAAKGAIPSPASSPPTSRSPSPPPSVSSPPPSSSSSSSSDEDLEVDLHALDRAKAEIDRLHLERQIREAVSTWNKAVKLWRQFISLGPYAYSLTRMSASDWRAATASTWAHFKEEMAHYWAGTKLLWVEIKIATRLLFKTLRGEPLSRRERRQMTRTTADVFRLVPFAAFVLIPFMELLLPVAIKLFPGMLPTTFRDELKREEELKKRLKAKLEVARFLQETVKVMAKGLKQSRSGYTREKADKLYDFMKKVRSGDATVTNEDITRFAKLFGDEFTLDHISRGQLTNMCKLVGIAPYGTDGYLRNSLRDKLRDLKNDDKVIRREGVESLSVAELQSVSRARGMRADTAERAVLERQINDWLDLSLNAKLPPSLLVLSRAFTITREAAAPAPGEELEAQATGAGDVSWSDASVDELAAKERQDAAMKDIQETLATLPEEVIISVTEEQQMASNRKEEVARKLEFLEQEEELIEEEAAEAKLEEEAAAEKAAEERERERERERTTRLTPTADEETAIDAHVETPGAADVSVSASVSAAERKDSESAVSRKKPSSYESIDSVSLDEVESVVAGKRAKRAARLSRLLAALAGASSLGVERKELMLLVRAELDLYGKRLRQVQAQLERLDGDAAVAAAVAAEGDVEAASAIEARASEELVEEEETERHAEASELVPDEAAEEIGGRDPSSSESFESERLADPFETIEEEEAEEGDVEKPGWFRANYDAQLCDRVNERVNKMLTGVRKDLEEADETIGGKLHVLDTDNDGRISVEELKRVGGVLAEALDEDDQRELERILADLSVDARGGQIDVAELTRVVEELIEREFADRDADADEDDDDGRVAPWEEGARKAEGDKPPGEKDGEGGEKLSA